MFVVFISIAAPAWAGERAVASGSRVRVRMGPCLESATVGYLKKDQAVAVLQKSSSAESIDGRQDYWYEVAPASGRPGWVFGGYLQIEAPAPVSMAGTWTARFTFERNTRNTDEPRHPWFTFRLDLREADGELAGTLHGLDQTVSGRIWGRMHRGRFRGTLRLDWDDHDWESLALEPAPDGRTASGIAVFQASPTERHFYVLELGREP